MGSVSTIPATPPQLIRPPEDLARSPFRHRARLFLSAFFIATMVLLFTGTWFHWDPVQSRENRNMARVPGWPRNFADAKTFSDRLMVFYRDHFGFRNSLIRGVALGEYHGGLGPEINNRVIVGKDGWLFYSKDEKFLADRGLDPFTEADLDAWQTLLEKRRKWFTDHGIAFIVVIPPDKQTIYPEFLPDRFAKPPTPSRLDQLISRLGRTHSPVQILDLRPALFEAKRHRQIYLKTDSHWNDYGAYTAYRVILDAIQRALPGRRLVPQPLTQFVSVSATRSGDLAQDLDLYFEYHEQTIELIRRDLYPNPDALRSLLTRTYTDGPDPHAPRLLLYNDSFSASLMQFLAPNFSRAYYAWNAWTSTVDPAPAKAQRPDVVVNEFVERKLHEPVPLDAQEIRTEKLR
jgi:alginate O-acetyltransferase complex protein AlgJ